MWCELLYVWGLLWLNVILCQFYFLPNVFFVRLQLNRLLQWYNRRKLKLNNFDLVGGLSPTRVQYYHSRLEEADFCSRWCFCRQDFWVYRHEVLRVFIWFYCKPFQSDDGRWNYIIFIPLYYKYSPCLSCQRNRLIISHFKRLTFS